MNTIQSVHSSFLVLGILSIITAGREVTVTGPDEVTGQSGDNITIPCSFTISPDEEEVPQSEYELRWINNTTRESARNIYIYSESKDFDKAVNVADESRYSRVNQSLYIENFTRADAGAYCCEITVTQNATALSNKHCVQLEYDGPDPIPTTSAEINGTDTMESMFTDNSTVDYNVTTEASVTVNTTDSLEKNGTTVMDEDIKPPSEASEGLGAGAIVGIVIALIILIVIILIIAFKLWMKKEKNRDKFTLMVAEW